MNMRTLLLAGSLALAAITSASADESGDEAEIVFCAAIPDGLI